MRVKTTHMNLIKQPYHHSTHRPRSLSKSQLSEGSELTVEITKSIHCQLFDLGHTPREVGRRHSLRDSEVVRIAVSYERQLSAKREERAWVAGRRSLLTPPPATARRAA